MSRVQSRPANPAPVSSSTERTPIKPGISPRPYSFIRPFPALPEQWQSPQAQCRLLNDYLTHDGHFATFAAQRNLSVDQLYDWLHSEEITLARRRLSDMAQERADLLARMARPAAIESLLNTLTKGCISDNQRRLAAGAILRAAAAADRREERGAKAQASSTTRPQPQAVPPVTGSSGGPCSAPEPADRLPPALRISTSVSPARALEGNRARQLTPAFPRLSHAVPLLPTRSGSPHLPARRAGSPIPPRRVRKRH
jgi:hypothetical protein